MAPNGSGNSNGRDRPLILHLSGDFPDPFELSKTKAIRSLVDLTADRFAHQVVSINRVSPGLAEAAREVVAPGPLTVTTQDFEYGTALTYVAPGKGVRHRTKLLQLGEWLAGHIAAMPRRPALIMGHKLAIEGIAVHRASELSGIPYGLSIQGDSDTKIMDVRRDLTGEFLTVLHGAKVIFPFAPWAWERAVERLGVPGVAPIMLPCPTELDQPLAPVIGDGSLLSVFHLMSHRRKNLAGMVQAIRLLEAEGSAPKLAIIGGGEASARERCEALAAQTQSITLQGAKERDAVRAAMNAASAFVLPSLRESFGMVFVEALFAGLPIIYPKGTSVDGYFDGARFAIAVDARNPRAIAEAMREAVAKEAEMKAALTDWQGSQAMQKFQRDSIASAFASGLLGALGSPQ